MFWPGGRGGTQEHRKVTLKEELLRIIFCCALIVVFALVIIGTLLVEAMMLGPIWGVILCAVVVFFLVTGPFGRLAYDVDSDHYRGYTLGMLVAAEFVCGVFLYPVLERFWPPSLPWSVPVWVGSIVVTMFSVIQVVMAGGIYLLASEAFDPNGPTPTRKPIEYPKSIFPWTKIREEILDSPPAPAPRQVRIHHEKVNDGGDRLVLLPDTLDWRQYARALSNGAANFSEAGAKRFGISPQDKKDRSTHQVTEYGFRSVRDRLLTSGHISYQNENARNMGYVFTDAFWELMDNWGEEPTETPEP